MTSPAESALTAVHRVGTAEPEQRLLAAILFRAAIDAGSDEPTLRDEARTWLHTSALPLVSAIAPADSDPAALHAALLEGLTCPEAPHAQLGKDHG